jgi:hypothetical protein
LLEIRIILENTFEVNLNRSQNGLGLSLSGGLAENRPIEIVNLYQNQPAALSGQLEIGDVVLSINDILMHNRNVRVCSFDDYKIKSLVFFLLSVGCTIDYWRIDTRYKTYCLST